MNYALKWSCRVLLQGGSSFGDERFVGEDNNGLILFHQGIEQVEA